MTYGNARYDLLERIAELEADAAEDACRIAADDPDRFQPMRRDEQREQAGSATRSSSGCRLHGSPEQSDHPDKCPRPTATGHWPRIFGNPSSAAGRAILLDQRLPPPQVPSGTGEARFPSKLADVANLSRKRILVAKAKRRRQCQAAFYAIQSGHVCRFGLAARKMPPEPLVTHRQFRALRTARDAFASARYRLPCGANHVAAQPAPRAFRDAFVDARISRRVPHIMATALDAPVEGSRARL
jgi:hypothetical protein